MARASGLPAARTRGRRVLRRDAPCLQHGNRHGGLRGAVQAREGHGPPPETRGAVLDDRPGAARTPASDNPARMTGTGRPSESGDRPSGLTLEKLKAALSPDWPGPVVAIVLALCPLAYCLLRGAMGASLWLDEILYFNHERFPAGRAVELGRPGS